MDELANNLPSGYVLDHYNIREVLGAGTFGITYKAFDDKLEKWVAIKEFLPSEMAGRGPDRITVQPRKDESEKFRFGLDQFLQEARTLARFDHPNIVRVTRFLESNGTAYLVMDYVEGQSLSRYLKYQPSPVSEPQLKAWFIPILQGLSAVHAAGFLHRDIKPGNIYLRDKGGPVLIDFGAARQALGEHSRSVTGILTPGFAPIEQYGTDGKKQGPWTDLYAVGATLYRCIAGNTPIDASTRQFALVEGDVDPLVPASVKGAGRYSSAFLELIDKLMVLPIKDRPQTASPVLAALIDGKSDFGNQAFPDRAKDTKPPDASGWADAATVLASDREQAIGPRTPVPPKATSAREVREKSKIAVPGVIGVVLIFGLLVTWVISVPKNPPKPQIEQNAEIAVCAKNPTCMMEAGADILLNPATDLEWTKADNGEDISWNKAGDWCESKGDGWRLPSVEEFASIYDATATIAPLDCGLAKCFVSPLFRLSSPFFWRSEVTKSGAGEELVGFFAFNEDLGAQPGADELTNNDGLRALCVRRP